MTNLDPESVGPKFQEELVVRARTRTLEIIRLASRQIKAGMTEDQARGIVKELLQTNQCEKSWHAPQIRFGVNTLRAFGEPGVPGVILAENDLFFLDLGPIFGGHEGDVGRTYAIGCDPEMIKIAADAEKIWMRVRGRWNEARTTGSELYSYAKSVSAEFGWVLSLYEANGHRIADFPHVAKQRGSIEELDFTPSPNKWIH
jgi:methionyl aminopeptidase